MSEFEFSFALRDRAWVATNGELGWTRADAIQASKELADAGMAVLGGELWRVLSLGRWHGGIPQSRGADDAVWGWEAEAWNRPVETWDEFCRRSAETALKAIGACQFEEWVAPECIPDIRFNLTYGSRAEYDKQ